MTQILPKPGTHPDSIRRGRSTASPQGLLTAALLDFGAGARSVPDLLSVPTNTLRPIMNAGHRSRSIYVACARNSSGCTHISKLYYRHFRMTKTSKNGFYPILELFGGGRFQSTYRVPQLPPPGRPPAVVSTASHHPSSPFEDCTDSVS